jgi:hypothetical protein
MDKEDERFTVTVDDKRTSRDSLKRATLRVKSLEDLKRTLRQHGVEKVSVHTIVALYGPTGGTMFTSNPTAIAELSQEVFQQLVKPHFGDGAMSCCELILVE